MPCNLPNGYSRVKSGTVAFRWLKKNHLNDAHTREIRVGHGPQKLYYWPDDLITLAPQVNEKRVAASQKAAEAKRQQIIDWVTNLDIKIMAPQTLAVLAQRAIKHRNDYRGVYRDRNGFGGDDRDGFEPFVYAVGCEKEDHVQRWMENYLRHENSNYEQHLERMFGAVGVRQGYEILRGRVDGAVKRKLMELIAIGQPTEEI